jgi:Flp pilus assembly pilin Flp
MRKLKHFLKDKGQTSVEYILLIAMVAIISSTLFGNLEKFIISNPDSVLNTYLTGLSDVFGSSGSGQFKYKRFILRR